MIGLALASACHAGLPVVKVARGPAESARPTTSPAAQAAAALLQAPAGPHATLAGQVRVDAGYLVATGRGRLAADGSAVTLADAGLIANNGGNVISDHGAGILANNGGTIVANSGGGLLSDAASSLLASADAGLIANNGSGLIGKVKYALAAAGPPPGTLLPAAGIALFVLDLRTGHAVPVGADAAGQPVYVVHADAAGRYKLYLPADQAPNVRVVALPAGTDDPRLVYNLVAPGAGTGDEALDEDQAVATRWLRESLVTYLADLMTNGIFASLDAAAASDAAAQLGPVGDYIVAFKRLGVDRLPPERARPVMQALADAVCAYADLGAIQTSATSADSAYQGPRQPALPVIAATARAIDEAAAAKLAQNPHCFDDRPFLVDANRHRAARGLPPYAIAKPADLGVLIFGEYLDTTSKRQQEKLRYLLLDLGIGLDRYELLRAAYVGMFQDLEQVLLSDARARAAGLAALEAAAKAEAAKPAGPPAASPAPTPAPAWQAVSTLAGGEPGDADGPAATARFREPLDVCYDGAGGLFVADHGNHRIRRIDLVDPAHPVTTLAGTGTAGFLDGPADKAQLWGPRALAYDATANPPVLYFAEIDSARIRRLVLPPGGPAIVETIAGTGTGGFADGPGVGARFNAPGHLALAGHDRLYVADTDNYRVRAIDLADPAHPVTTVLGNGASDGFAIGDPVATVLRGPDGLALGPDGALYVADHYVLGRLSPGPVPRFDVLAGNNWGGSTDGYWVNAQVTYPGGMARDASGRLAIADNLSQCIRLATPDGPDAFSLTTLAGRGDPDHPGFADGPGDSARFAKPQGVAIAPDGTLYVADTENHRIRVLHLPR